MGGEAPRDCFSQRKMGERGSMGGRKKKEQKKNGRVRQSGEGGALAVRWCKVVGTVVGG